MTQLSAAAAMQEACKRICRKQGDEWDSNAVIMCKNYAAHCAEAIAALNPADFVQPECQTCGKALGDAGHIHTCTPRAQHDADSRELRRLCAERDALKVDLAHYKQAFDRASDTTFQFVARNDALTAENAALRAALPAQDKDADLLDIARTICCVAAKARVDSHEYDPSPLSEGSPLLMAAREACVKRGFTADGLATGATMQQGSQP